MFPFDQPTPTAFYLVCYLATLVLHVVPMNYVLAGSSYLALLGVWETVAGRPAAAHQAIAAKLRDWMPFALSVAITAGVAPLLFLQILYKQPFYTANLLLWHRWMAILPVLIVAFYLLYVQKSNYLAGDGRRVMRAVVAVGILACFAFVAWSWTENHLLSTRGQEVWTAQYASGSLWYGDSELPPRLALWCAGAFPALAMVLAWQLRPGGNSPQVTRPLASIALVGLIASALAGIVYALALPNEIRTQIADAALPYLVLVGAGGVLQTTAWLATWRAGKLAAPLLVTATTGVIAATLGMTVLRELRRLAAIDVTEFYAVHARASGVGGLSLFLFFFLLNTLLIAGVLVMVRRGRKQPATA